MAGAEPRDFVHIVSGGGLMDPAERLCKLQSMLNCTWFIMLEFLSGDNLQYTHPRTDVLNPISTDGTFEG